MAKGTDKLPTVQSVIKTYTPEQVLLAFNIQIDYNNKCLCPFHAENIPSMQVNEDYVYCFGCQTSADPFRLAQQLLSKKYGREATHMETLSFFKDNHLPAATGRTYATSVSYQGAVPDALIKYWQSCMTDNLYAQLEKERLIIKDTAIRYNIGWRPDWQAWTIPFYRGMPGQSPVDIVQYRLTASADKKYVGLTGHNRASIMNADLLDEPQPYLLVFFGSFDSILARQDGVLAVGMNGSNPFKKIEKDRAQELFKNQTSIIVIPDNTASEYSPAYTFASWVGGQVRFFPTDLPDGCDYIDYRKLGYSALDFMQTVAGIEPITAPDDNLIANLTSLLDAGDPFQLASVHTLLAPKGQVVQDIARTLAKQGPFGPFSVTDWGKVKNKLWQVKNQKELCDTLDSIALTAKLLKNSAW